MTYNLGLRCSVCGSLITDDNPDGIGFGCRKNVIKPAEAATAKEIIIDFALQQWIFKVNIYRNEFLKAFEGHKFRNQFKKSFFESIKKSDKVSKKQLDVIKNMLEWKIDLNKLEEDMIEREKHFYFDLIEKAKHDKKWGEIYKKYFEMFKKQYLSQKNK